MTFVTNQQYIFLLLHCSDSYIDTPINLSPRRVHVLTFLLVCTGRERRAPGDYIEGIVREPSLPEPDVGLGLGLGLVSLGLRYELNISIWIELYKVGLVYL